ncbi:hypothetical protein CDCA_CDCA10G2906 [Cyanidium caldarium]|uniref:Uncharacterized protein n=1 Tax=Cyanidium caldarium TaxID=2771 RepID=A0AAV9IXN0_CYACA|nr:hypothetical protein CDCA_CDCA10G2906 [Cyanidium caldarium]
MRSSTALFHGPADIPPRKRSVLTRLQRRFLTQLLAVPILLLSLLSLCCLCYYQTLPPCAHPATLGVVVFAYQRPASLQRLLRSLDAVRFGDDTVPLHIWVDHSDRDDAWRVAQRWPWRHGPKTVERRERHHGICESWLHGLPSFLNTDYVWFLEDDIELGVPAYAAIRHGLLCRSPPDLPGMVLQRLPEVPTGAAVHFTSSWAPVFRTAYFRNFTEWVARRRQLAPDFRPFLPGHDRTFNRWLREERDVWSPWLRRFAFEYGHVFLALGDTTLVVNHREPGVHYTAAGGISGSVARPTHRLPPAVQSRLRSPSLLPSPLSVWECEDDGSVQCTPVAGGQEALWWRGHRDRQEQQLD